MIIVIARVSSPPPVGVPAPSATSNPPMRSRASRRKAMLAPTPNGGSGQSGLCGPDLVKVSGAKPRPLLCPPTCSNRFSTALSSLAGMTMPETPPTRSPLVKPLAIQVSQSSSGSSSSSRKAMMSLFAAAIPAFLAQDRPGRGSTQYRNCAPAPVCSSTTLRRASDAGALSTTTTSYRG